MANKSSVMEPHASRRHHEEPVEEEQPDQEEQKPQQPVQPPVKAPPQPQPADGAAPKAPPSPGQFAQPPLLGKAPTSLSNIIANLGDKASHFYGPVVSGGQSGFGPQASGGLPVQKVGGSALCAFFIQIDYTMGDFTMPILFPTDSTLLWAVPQVYTAFTGGTADTKFQLGRTSGGAEILAATAMGALHALVISPMLSTLPTYADAPGMTPFQAYLHIAQTGNTAGQGIVALIFARGYQKLT